MINNAGECKIISDDLEKANEFSNYFAEIYSIESNDSFSGLGEINLGGSMPMIQFSVHDVLQKLNKLNICKSPGPDTLHPKILFELRNVIAHPLTMLYKKSIRSGELPADWISSIVSVIHMKASKSSVSNYRLISLNKYSL